MSNTIYRPLADGEIANSNGLHIEQDGNGWLLRFGKNGPHVWFPNTVRLCEAIELPAETSEPLDWDRAKAHLDFMEQAYKESGDAGRFGLAITIMPLQDRYARGERTKWLYDDIMEVE